MRDTFFHLTLITVFLLVSLEANSDKHGL